MAILGDTKAVSLSLLDGVIGDLNPKTTNVYDLGTSSLKWRNIYGTLKGNADTATSATSATTANKLNYVTQLTTQAAIDGFLEGSKFQVGTFKTTEANNLNMGSNDGIIISLPWTSANYGAQIALDDNTAGVIKFRGKASSWGDWRTVLHDGNYTSYTVTKTGTGASGTWGINITGSSASCTGNAATATEFSSNATVKLTGDVTGEASAKKGWTLTTTIGSGKVTNAMLAGSIANGKLANSSVSIAGNSVSLGGSLAADTLRTSLGLSNAMHFIGVATVAITDGSTTDPVISGYSTKTAGDVIIDKDTAYEFVWSGSKWERLGPDGSYKVVQTAYTDSTGTSESTTATRFVYSVSQDANGVVSFKTRPLPTYNNYSLPLAASGTRGGIQIGYSESGNNYAVKLSSEKAYVSVPWTDTKQNVTLATTSKAYLTGVTTTPTSSAQALTGVADTGVYLTTTAGEISAVRHSFNVGGTEKAYMTYNSTTNSIDFIFV